MANVQLFLRQIAFSASFQVKYCHRFIDSNKVGIAGPLLTRLQSTLSSVFDEPEENGKKIKMSKAMKAYLERARKHDEFMKIQTHDYEIGKRHLANMMGEDPETFSQKDIDNAIEYLMPSGLYDRLARPMFKHPTEIFPKKKAAEFDFAGRPFHFQFYTGLPNFYEVLFETTERILKLNEYEDKMISVGVLRPEESLKADLGGTQWLPKADLENLLIENLHDKNYDQFLICLNRLAFHPYSSRETDFIMKYRKKLMALGRTMDISPLNYDENGVAYIEASGGRKNCRATVTIRDRGTGKIEINGQDLSYFDKIQDREQIMFPLHFVGKLHKVDVKGQVSGEGTSARAGAVRYAISLALRSFLTEEEVERMRLAGLLTRDPRQKERKKPGQEGARRKRTCSEAATPEASFAKPFSKVVWKLKRMRWFEIKAFTETALLILMMQWGSLR